MSDQDTATQDTTVDTQTPSPTPADAPVAGPQAPPDLAPDVSAPSPQSVGIQSAPAPNVSAPIGGQARRVKDDKTIIRDPLISTLS